jgi:predicted glycosyltransferase
MKILFDINHPAHVHFFKIPTRMLIDQGHEVIITSRDKDIAIDLLDELNIRHIALSAMKNGGFLALGKELLMRDISLYRVVKDVRPDIMAAIGGTFIAHVGKITKIPSLVFYDTENAKLQNAITYPFASCVITPRCYESWVPKRKHVQYPGYHELSYLHPNYFKPDMDIASANGFDTDRPNYFVRLLSWQANHDIGETGWSSELISKVVNKLGKRGNVIISSEGPLAKKFQSYVYSGQASKVHYVMAFCDAYIGESATMASECAVLGVPSVYVAATGRGYTNEQERRYGLVTNVRKLDWITLETAIEGVLKQPQKFWHQARQKLLRDTIDVADFVVSSIVNFCN